MSTTNIDRVATFPLVSSKNIIEARNLHNNLANFNQVNNNIADNIQRTSQITTKNMSPNNQQYKIRQGQSPFQSSNIVRKDSTISN